MIERQVGEFLSYPWLVIFIIHRIFFPKLFDTELASLPRGLPLNLNKRKLISKMDSFHLFEHLSFFKLDLPQDLYLFSRR